MVVLLEGQTCFLYATTKGLLTGWFPETNLCLSALCLFLKSLSWLQIWWEVSQRACPQPPMRLRFGLYPPSGLEGATGCWTWPWERNGSQRECRSWASCSPLPAGAGSVRPLTRVFRTLNRWLKHQYKSFQTSQKAKNLVWTPTEIFHSGAL